MAFTSRDACVEKANIQKVGYWRRVVCGEILRNSFGWEALSVDRDTMFLQMDRLRFRCFELMNVFWQPKSFRHYVLGIMVSRDREDSYVRLAEFRHLLGEE